MMRMEYDREGHIIRGRERGYDEGGYVQYIRNLK
jgi:hypothetical protein